MTPKPSLRVLILAASVLLPAHAGAEPVDASPDAAVIQMIAAKILAEPPDSHPRTIKKFVILGRPYFYVRAACCDQYNRLYTAEGVYLCAPDGGVHGGGTRDRECPHVRINHTEGEEVWRDSRPSRR